MIDNSKEFSVITVTPNKEKKPGEKSRVLFVSDLHMGAGYGTWPTETSHTFHRGGNIKITDRHVITYRGKRMTLYEDTVLPVEAGETVVFHNGITCWERGLLLIDSILYEWDTTHPDCVIFLGDIISNEYNSSWYSGGREHFEDMEYHFWTKFKRDYCCRLDEAGIPWYFVYANHDDLTDEQFASLFPYTKNFVLNIGKESYVCIDSFWDPVQTPEMRKWGYGNPSDARPEFLDFAKEEIKNKDNAFIVTHFVNPISTKIAEFFVNNKNVICGIEGHTHEILTRKLAEDGERKFIMYQTGEFSWGADTWGIVNDETIAERRKANDHTPICFTLYYSVLCEKDGESEVANYPVFPDIEYGITQGCGGRYKVGRVFDSFHQLRYDGSVDFKTDAAVRFKVTK